MSDGEVSMEKKTAVVPSYPTKSRSASVAVVNAIPNSNTNTGVGSAQSSVAVQNVDTKSKSDVYRTNNSRGGGGRYEKTNKSYPVLQKRSTGPPQHKTRGLFNPPDKRPLPRNNNSGTSGFRNQVAKSSEAELGSLSRPGSKKGGLNRMLACDGFGSKSWDRGTLFRQKYMSSCTAGDYNKEHYIQANCQFVVCDAFDYSRNILDPDLLVDWEQIEEMRIICDEMPSCPICLYPPVAAKITRCGHIYCWSCILHYLALSDKQWRKCPICFESVYGKQLKSVVASRVEKAAVDGHIKMRLMRRQKGDTVALPVGQWKNYHGELLDIEDNCSRYSKLLKISHQRVRETIVKRERQELEIQLALDKDEPESCFIQQALDYLDEREEAVQKAITMREVHSGPLLAGSLSPDIVSQQFNLQDNRVGFFMDAFENSEAKALASDINEERISLATRIDGGIEMNVAAASPTASQPDSQLSNEYELSRKSVYFYQADDGQHVYMSPFSVRCLIHEYGSLEGAPELVGGKILQLDSYVMTEEVRQRFRYISHLPLFTCFTLAELRFDKGTLSRETIGYFADEFARRNRDRTKRDREDTRRAIKAERWDRACLMNPANYVLAKLPSCPVPDIPIITYVPSGQGDIDANLVQQAVSDSNPPLPTTDQRDARLSMSSNDGFNSPPPGTSESEGKAHGHIDQTPPSFAQMLKSGKPKPNTSPKPTASQQGTSSTSESGSTVRVDDSEECLPAPAYQNTLGDALQAAFDNLKIDEQRGSSGIIHKLRDTCSQVSGHVRGRTPRICQ